MRHTIHFVIIGIISVSTVNADHPNNEQAYRLHAPPSAHVDFNAHITEEDKRTNWSAVFAHETRYLNQPNQMQSNDPSPAPQTPTNYEPGIIGF